MRNSIPGVAFAVASGVLLSALLAGCTTAVPVPPDATDDEVDAYVAQQLAFLQLGLLDPAGRLVADGPIRIPAASRVAFTSPETWSGMQASCLLAAGLDAREISGGFTIDDPGNLDPTEVFIAQYTCLQQYPVDPRLNGFLGEDQALYMYDYFTTRLAPCLRTLGFDVPPPPARDQYVALVRDGSPWNPYYREDGAPIAQTASQWVRINTQCPPLPDDPFARFRPEQSRTSAED